MASRSSFSLLSFICNWNSKRLRLVSIHYKTENPNIFEAEPYKISKLAKYFWLATVFVSLAMSLVDFGLSVNNSAPDSQNLILVVYHGFLLLAKFSTYSSIYIFNTNSIEIVHLFNCLYKRASFVRLRKSKYKKESKSNRFPVFLVVCAASLCIFFLLFLPTVALLLPIIYETEFNRWHIASCKVKWIRIYLFMTQFLFCLPISAFAPLFSTSCLLTLKVLWESLENLWYLHAHH